MKETLLISLLFVHWLCDFTHLSRPWMLSAKRFGKPLLPIFCHALFHAVLMGLAISVWTKIYTGYNCLNWKVDYIDYAITFELITHFIIDILKGRLNGWFPKLQNPANVYHWYVFGFDQLLHIIVITVIVFNIVK